MSKKYWLDLFTGKTWEEFLWDRVRYLKPEFIEEISESCEAGEL